LPVLFLDIKNCWINERLKLQRFSRTQKAFFEIFHACATLTSQKSFIAYGDV